MMEKCCFNQYVIDTLRAMSINAEIIQHTDRYRVFDSVNEELNKDCFPHLERDKGHRPDLIIVQPEKSILIETKSLKEIYDTGRFSNAHILSYLFQTIFGQSSSYSFLYTHGKANASLWLMIPARVPFKTNVELQEYLDKILEAKDNNHIKQYKDIMKIESVDFVCPAELANGAANPNYRIIAPEPIADSNPGILATEIRFTIS